MRMNVFTFTGRLGKDADLRYMQNGKAVCGFSVAVESGYGDKKTTSWIDCALFDKRAEALHPYLQKSALVAVSGELTIEQWTDKDGNKQRAVRVRVADLTLLGGKPKSQQAETEPTPKQTAHDDLADDIPF
jgi:single-strand DNA-binding protein